jgi:hypothetical protein
MLLSDAGSTDAMAIAFRNDMSCLTYLITHDSPLALPPAMAAAANWLTSA